MREIFTPALTEMIVDCLSACVLAFLLWAGVKLVPVYERLTKSKLTSDQRERLLRALRACASYADELGRKFAKGLAASGPTTGAQKMALAISEAKEREPELTAQLTAPELQKLIESELPAVRAASIPPAVVLTPSTRPPASSLPPLGSLFPPPPSIAP